MAQPLELPDGWRLKRELGSGDELGRVVEVEVDGARAVLRTAAGAVAEMGLIGRILHPGLATPSRGGVLPDGTPFVLRPWIEGTPFGAADPEELVRLAGELLGALGALHDAGFVHRDLKADNVLVTAEGQLQVIDFGFAAPLAAPGSVGSPTTVAPEVLLGQPAGRAADLFSVGAMLAQAVCGIPAPAFHERFPAASYWDASESDPARIPASLRPLVMALVRRLPAARPTSAAAARAYLSGGLAGAPDLRLPFLAGRAAAFDRLVDSLVRGASFVAIRVAPSEGWALLEQLQVALAGRGVASEEWSRREQPTRPAPRRVHWIEPGSPVDAVLDPALRQLLGQGHDALLWLAPAADVAELEEELGIRMDSTERAGLVLSSWPALSIEVVEQHLNALFDGAAPAAAQQLASSLVDVTGGAWSAVCDELVSAEQRGVLQRKRAGGFAPQVTEWPRDAADATSELRGLSGASVTILATLGAARRASGAELVRVLAGLAPAVFSMALAELRTRGLVREASDEGWRLAAATRIVARVAYESLPLVTRQELHDRFLAQPEALSTDLERLRHQLLGSEAPSVDRVLEGLDLGRRRGALSEAGELFELWRDAAGTALDEEPTRSRVLALSCRLESSRGDALGALEALRELFGPSGKGASAEVLVAGALAAEAAGDRTTARRWLKLSARAPGHEDAAVVAWSCLGHAYGKFLDGDLAEAERLLERHGDAVGSLEARLGMLHLRGAVHTARAELDDARRVYAEAIVEAREAGELMALARGETNLAQVERRRAKLPLAREGLQRALVLFDAHDHPVGRANALNSLGALDRDLGDVASARAAFESALALRRLANDGYGAAVSGSNLAVLALDSGQPGLALQLLDRAQRELSRGEYSAERETLHWQRVAALSLASRPAEAAQLASERPSASTADELLAAWAMALLEFSSGHPERAREVLNACERGDLVTRPGDVYRFAALRQALLPEDDKAAQDLREATQLIGGPVREAETAWRLRSRSDSAPTREQVANWLGRFEAAGRTDLAACVGTELAALISAPDERRLARARAAEASEALVDGLEPAAKQPSIDRLMALAGAPAAGSSGRQLAWASLFQQRLAREEDLEGLLATVVDMALDVTGAKRGMVLIRADQQPEVSLSRRSGGLDLGTEAAQFSRTLVLRAMESGQPIVTTDAAADARFAGTASIEDLRLRSILCYPFELASGGRGALLLDDELQDSAFDGADLTSIGLLADQAALALAWMRRRDELAEANRRLAARVVRQDQELQRARRRLRRSGPLIPEVGLVGESAAMNRVLEQIESFAPTDLPVLVTGPSGTGKELVAKALHARSLRAGAPLVMENVAAVPAALLESELFGSVRGAYTGADRDRAGLFNTADGGSFVLDEMGEMPFELQAKLLRVLESGEFRAIGSRVPTQVDVRIIAVTHRDLLKRSREGEFRSDLYYRLNAAEIRVPSLTERDGDLPLLVTHFLDRLNKVRGTSKTIHDEVMSALSRRAWPGEVRELSNEVMRLYYLSGEAIADAELVRDVEPAEESTLPEGEPASLRLEDAERLAIERALIQAGGRKDLAARLLGISRAGLYTKLKRLGLSQPGGSSSER